MSIERVTVIASRLLSKEERRLLADALRLLGVEARKAKSYALANPNTIGRLSVSAHVDELSRRAGTADRLAAEISEYEVRLEKAPS